VIDLKNWDFEKNGPVLLSGKWNSYWQKLVTPQELPTVLRQKAIPVDVPGTLEKTIPFVKLANSGYGTYHLRILTDQNNNAVALKFKKILTAFSSFGNGEKIASSGIVSTSRQTSTPRLLPQVAEVKPTGDVVDLLIQVSNFHFTKGEFQFNAMRSPPRSNTRFNLVSFMFLFLLMLGNELPNLQMSPIYVFLINLAARRFPKPMMVSTVGRSSDSGKTPASQT
jgi:hypothetical protein